MVRPILLDATRGRTTHRAGRHPELDRGSAERRLGALGPLAIVRLAVGLRRQPPDGVAALVAAWASISARICPGSLAASTGPPTVPGVFAHCTSCPSRVAVACSSTGGIASATSRLPCSARMPATPPAPPRRSPPPARPRPRSPARARRPRPARRIRRTRTRRRRRTCRRRPGPLGLDRKLGLVPARPAYLARRLLCSDTCLMSSATDGVRRLGVLDIAVLWSSASPSSDSGPRRRRRRRARLTLPRWSQPSRACGVSGALVASVAVVPQRGRRRRARARATGGLVVQTRPGRARARPTALATRARCSASSARPLLASMAPRCSLTAVLARRLVESRCAARLA